MDGGYLNLTKDFVAAVMTGWFVANFAVANGFHSPEYAGFAAFGLCMLTLDFDFK